MRSLILLTFAALAAAPAFAQAPAPGAPAPGAPAPALPAPGPLAPLQQPGPSGGGLLQPPPAPPDEVRPSPDGLVMPWPPMLIPHEEGDPAERLDSLFAELKATTDEEEAMRLERRIVVAMLNSGSETVDLLMTWATESIMEQDYPLALDLLDSVVLLAPDYAEGWNRRATVYFRMGDFGHALDDIQRTLTLEPRHFQAIAGLGIILRSLDRKEQAIQALKAALEIHPFLDGVAEAIEDLEGDFSRDI
jgi:tetratricopeptide (TPR) repeat protein